jgi:multicomponent Na+:H+ antiporter subunit D
MLALPLGIAWVGAVVVGCLDGRRRGVQILAAAILAAALAAMVALAAAVFRDGPVQVVAGGWAPGVGIRLRADALGVSFAVVSLAVLLVCLLYETTGQVRARSFPALVLAMAAGLSGLFLTADAFNFYVFFEISMTAAYVLTAYGEKARQLRSAVIFSVANLLGSIFFLFAIAALYHVTGTLDMASIAARARVTEENPMMTIGAMLFAAFGIKLGLFPFHPWLPPVYTGTRPAVAAILSGALAGIGSYGLLRFGAGILDRELATAAPVLALLGVASILYGGVQAVSRHDPLEVLAYSSIGQVGYVLIALAIGGPAGYAAAVLFALLNAAIKTLLFLAAPTRGWLAGVPFAVGALAVAGVPPVSGFWSKAAVIRASLEAPGLASAALILAIVVGGALSFVYMFQVYQRTYWEATVDRATVSTPGRRLIVAALAVTVLLLGLLPGPLLAVSERAAAVLGGGGP